MFFLRFLPVIFVTGCVTFGEKPEDLYSMNYESKEYCYSESEERVTDKVKAYLLQCVTSGINTIVIPVGGAFVPISKKSTRETHQEIIEGGKRLSVHTDYGYSLTVFISNNNPDCKTNIKMHAMNNLWGDSFALIDKAILHNEIVCD